MRIWITKLEDVALVPEVIDPNTGLPRTRQHPRGLDIESAWAQWPIVDDDDQVQVGDWIVALARDLDTAPSWGRDGGDPTEVWEDQDLGALDKSGQPVLTQVLVSPFHTVPLGSTFTELVEDQIGMERDELAGATRAEVLRAITADEGAAIGCTWGAAKVGSRVWLRKTKQVRRFRRRADRIWWDSLTPAQRTFIRNRTDEQKDEMRATPIPDRAALALSWV